MPIEFKKLKYVENSTVSHGVLFIGNSMMPSCRTYLFLVQPQIQPICLFIFPLSGKHYYNIYTNTFPKGSI